MNSLSALIPRSPERTGSHRHPPRATDATLARVQQRAARVSRAAMASRSRDEHTLVRRVQRGDREAFAQIYDKYVDRIYRYAYYRVGQVSDAEDITAQVFLKAWQAIGQYRTRGRPFAAWLYRIAHNTIIDRFRTHRSAAPLEQILALADHGDTVEELAEQHLTADGLRQAISQLTGDQQEVLILRFLEGYSAVEAAHIMERSPGAVRTLQHRSLVRLRHVLSRDPERCGSLGG